MAIYPQFCPVVKVIINHIFMNKRLHCYIYIKRFLTKVTTRFFSKSHIMQNRHNCQYATRPGPTKFRCFGSQKKRIIKWKKGLFLPKNWKEGWKETVKNLDTLIKQLNRKLRKNIYLASSNQWEEQKIRKIWWA